MYYVVTYSTPFGDNITTCLEEDEFGLLLVPCKVLFKSKSKRIFKQNKKLIWQIL